MFDKPGEKEEQRNEGLTTAALAGAGEEREQVATPSAAEAEEQPSPLFPAVEAQDLRLRWDSIQTAFVDHPREAVQEADKLVAATMKRMAETFADEREHLEGQWDRGDNVSTEDLRLALRRYRSFFHRLLSI